MKLDRNENASGKGKYALLKLRSVEYGAGIASAIDVLDDAGLIEWGLPGTDGEFFVMKLRDAYAAKALEAYAEVAMQEDEEFATEVLRLADRARQHPNRKLPD